MAVQPSKLRTSLPEGSSSEERVRSADTNVAGGSRAPHIREQEIRPKEVPPSDVGKGMPEG